MDNKLGLLAIVGLGGLLGYMYLKGNAVSDPNSSQNNSGSGTLGTNQPAYTLVTQGYGATTPPTNYTVYDQRQVNNSLNLPNGLNPAQFSNNGTTTNTASAGDRNYANLLNDSGVMQSKNQTSPSLVQGNGQQLTTANSPPPIILSTLTQPQANTVLMTPTQGNVNAGITGYNNPSVLSVGNNMATANNQIPFNNSGGVVNANQASAITSAPTNFQQFQSLSDVQKGFLSW